MPSKLSQEEFLSKAKATHGSRWDYSRAVYTVATAKVEILCPAHGAFFQLPGNHVRGTGCPACVVLSKSVPRFDTKQFAERASRKHSNRYDYSDTVYAGHDSAVEIRCPDHGTFRQRANNHLAGIGCPRCGREKSAGILLKDSRQFAGEAAAAHNGKYSYGLVSYRGAFVPVEIVCLKHGVFWQTPDNHLNAGAGCPSCSNRHSKPQAEIEKLLSSLGVEFRANDRTAIAPHEIDVWVPSSNLGIEFNGRYWHSLDKDGSASVRNRHRDKFRACRKKGISLLQIDEHEWDDPATREVWKSVIASKLGKHKRIFARRTAFRQIAKEEAERFLKTNHLQGTTPVANAEWCFGLLSGESLVAVMTFARHEKKLLNLTRLAFPLGISVVGGAQKLFQNALPFLPRLDIVTFSNNRYSSGRVYERLGFSKEESLPPSYQWYFRGKMWNKRQLRHKRLPSVLGEGYNPKETAHANLYRAGARCLYDAGYERWRLSR